MYNISLGFKKYLSNIGWMFFSRIGSMIISFFTTIYVVRYLGPENYGQLSYAISFVGIFSIFSSLGIDQILFREIIQHPEEKNKYLGTALALKFVAGLATLLVLFITAYSLSSNDVSLYLILIISLSFLFNIWNVVSYQFQAEVKSKYPSIINFTVVIITSVLKVYVCMSGKGVIFLSVVLLADSVIYAIFYIVFHKNHYGNMREWIFDKTIAKKLLKYSMPLLFSGAFAVIYGRIDQVMIKYLVDTRSVGIYDAAARIAEVWYFFPALIVSSFFPALINAKKYSEREYCFRVKRLFLLITFTSIMISLPITFFSDFIVNTIYGADFIASGQILQIYVWGGVGMSISFLLNNFLLAEHKHTMILISTGSAMIINVVLNLLFIPKFGIQGAAWATLISYLCISLSIFFFKDTRRRVGEILRS